jgi:uncharacterized protein YegP (UPF0339 family)
MIFNSGGNGPNIPNKEKILRITQVWANADPSVAFLAQNVEFNSVSGTVMYIVEYRMYRDNTGSYKTELVVPNHHTVLGSNYYDHKQYRFVQVTRNVTITDGSANFSDDSIDGENGEYVVPVAIYALHT